MARALGPAPTPDASGRATLLRSRYAAMSRWREHGSAGASPSPTVRGCGIAGLHLRGHCWGGKICVNSPSRYVQMVFVSRTNAK